MFSSWFVVVVFGIPFVFLFGSHSLKDHLSSPKLPVEQEGKQVLTYWLFVLNFFKKHLEYIYICQL